MNLAFAQVQKCGWLILSAKYGFIEPSFLTPGYYNVTLKNKKSGPISIDELHRQVAQKRLEHIS
jgi:hypothetical protein